jgi:hypothetical protein
MTGWPNGLLPTSSSRKRQGKERKELTKPTSCSKIKRPSSRLSYSGSSSFSGNVDNENQHPRSCSHGSCLPRSIPPPPPHTHPPKSATTNNCSSWKLEPVSIEIIPHMGSHSQPWLLLLLSSPCPCYTS